MEQPNGSKRRGTSTARFGSSRREGHDASGFYERFVAPELSAEETLVRPTQVDVIWNRDARDMSILESNSVALVVTSPPYFAGKEYEQSMGQGGVPGSYIDYLELLRDVFRECKRVLEPGGRIAVNVANLGRRPYRSLAGDVTQILQDLGLLLRGEVVWWKGKAAGGSCAWGTFQRPGNPVLRDVTERIVIASKGRFDRALGAQKRLEQGHPSVATISREEFLEATTDLWEIPSESASRVGHPAPFPVELPQRLIDLYTYQDDVVMDPFMGSGSTAVAALRTQRHFVGFESDRSYVDGANARIKDERSRLRSLQELPMAPGRVQLPAIKIPANESEDPQTGAIRGGLNVHELAGIIIEACGFTNIRSEIKLPAFGVEISYIAKDKTGQEWAFDVSGALAYSRTGLKRSDTLWKTIAKAAVLREAGTLPPLVLLTTDPPASGTSGASALATVMGPGRPVFDLIEILSPQGQERLRAYALEGCKQ